MTKKSDGRIGREMIKQILEDHTKQKTRENQAAFQEVAREVMGEDTEYNVANESNPIFVLLDLVRIINYQKNILIDNNERQNRNIVELKQEIENLQQEIDQVRADVGLG